MDVLRKDGSVYGLDCLLLEFDLRIKALEALAEVGFNAAENSYDAKDDLIRGLSGGARNIAGDWRSFLNAFMLLPESEFVGKDDEPVVAPGLDKA